MTAGRSRRSFALLLLGVLVLQTGWLLAVGPFRGIDEFDHAQKADAVAAGQWQSPDDALVTVRADLNTAVRPVCRSRSRESDNCGPTAAVTGGRVLVYSTASAYNPVFYAVVGTLARPFAGDGYAELYAMRVTVLLINGLLVALGLHLALHAFRTSWPFVAAVAAITPVATYAGMVVAPNGVENSCAFLLWMLLLASCFGRADVSRGWLLPALVMTGVGLGLLRALGPFWLLCIATAVLVAAGRTTTWQRIPRRVRVMCAGTWGLSCALGAAWTLQVGTSAATTASVSVTGGPLASASTTADPGAHASDLPVQMIVWMLQVVGAIPYRDEPLPVLVYAVVLTLWGWLVIVGLRHATRSQRLAWCAVLAVSIAVPIVTSLATLSGGWIWQGRYGWPLGIGLLLLAGTALDATPPRLPDSLVRWIPSLVGATMALAIAVSVLHVTARERRYSPLSGHGTALTLPDPVLALLVVAGFALVVGATVGAHPSLPAERKAEPATCGG